MAASTAQPVTGSPAGYTIIGPPQSGKTSLIAALLEMAGSSYTDHPGPLPVLQWAEGPGNPANPANAGNEASDTPAEVLPGLRRDIAQAIHNGGRFGATGSRTASCRLSMSLQGGLMSGVLRPLRTFNLVDGGGELLMPATEVDRDQAYAEGRQAHAAALRHAQGVILCIPVYPSAPWGQQEGMREIMALLRSSRCRLERLVICLTKYDYATAAYGCKAFDLAQREDVFSDQVIPEVLGSDFLESLRLLSSSRAERGTHVDIAITPVSVYGFIDRNGCANFDLWHPRGSGGMLLQAEAPEGESVPGTREWPLYEAAEVRRHWVPYRIIEPFTYLLTGQGGSLTIPLDRLLKRGAPSRS
jgi:hypothetical protein